MHTQQPYHRVLTALRLCQRRLQLTGGSCKGDVGSDWCAERMDVQVRMVDVVSVSRKAVRL